MNSLYEIITNTLHRGLYPDIYSLEALTEHLVWLNVYENLSCEVDEWILTYLDESEGVNYEQ